jgi:tetratricopeptide (TPR) repeat protein
VRPFPAILLVLAACGGGAASHEHLGDSHYLAGRFEDAITEYRLAQADGSAPSVWAKLGSAALLAGRPADAISAYDSLAQADPVRVAEAARGLERAARLQQADEVQVGRAVAALQRLVPDRPLGRLAMVPGAGARRGTDARMLLPSALAGAASSAEVNQVLLRYATSLRDASGCEEATTSYRTALRRIHEPALRQEIQSGLAGCGLRLGLRALESDRPELAEQWFTEAASVDAGGPNGLRARIGWGDARLRQGDVLGAAITWQSVVSASGAPDSLAQMAAARINALASAEPPEGGDTR